jgi:hypothetical protein
VRSDWSITSILPSTQEEKARRASEGRADGAPIAIDGSQRELTRRLSHANFLGIQKNSDARGVPRFLNFANDQLRCLAMLKQRFFCAPLQLAIFPTDVFRLWHAFCITIRQPL